MKITALKVTLKSIYSSWVSESIDCDPKDRDAIIQIIKEQYALMGLEVMDVRFEIQEGDAKPKEEPREPDVPVEQLTQYHKPRMTGPGIERMTKVIVSGMTGGVSLLPDDTFEYGVINNTLTP